MKGPSLFYKLTLLVIPLVVLSGLATGLGLGYISRRAFTDYIRTGYSLAAAQSSRSIERFLQETFNNTEIAASLLSALRLDDWRTEMALIELNQRFPKYEIMELIQENGREKGEKSPSDAFKNTIERAWQGQSVHSGIVLLDQKPVMYICAPVMRDGLVRAVVGGRINLKPIWDQVIYLKNDLELGPGGHVYLVDEHHSLIASDEISKNFGHRLDLPGIFDTTESPLNSKNYIVESQELPSDATLETMLHRMNRRPEFLVAPLAGRETIILKSSLNNIPWTLYIVQPQEEAFRFLSHGLWLSVGLVLGVILLGGTAVWLHTKRVIAPITRLHHGVERAARGDFSKPIEIGSQDEVGDLAEHFNEMQASLKDYFNRLVTATNDLTHTKCMAVLGTTASQVNHQIGNFLNNLVLALSILKEDELSEPSRTSLTIVEENTLQIKEFIERLLRFSAKADLILAPWRPREELAGIVEAQRPSAEAFGLELSLEIDTDANILADHPLLEQAIVNLITNAFEATGPGGRVTVRAYDDADGVRIDVIDTGSGIDEKDIEQIFMPFFTTKKGKGTGLGLSMTQTVIQAHGGEVRLTGAGKKGTCASCWLPAAPARLVSFSQDEGASTGPGSLPE